MRRMVRFLNIIPIFFLLAVAVHAGDQVFFYHTDPAGTPLAMTDTGGSVVWRADYKPFGEEQLITGTKENDRRFVGKEKDEETGLLYFGARYMESMIGRFVAPDPVGAVDEKKTVKIAVDEKTGKIAVDQKIKKINVKNIENPQGLNLYAYALNNPYKFLDVLGLFWEYSQSTGGLTNVNNQTGERTPTAPGYSGSGAGLNNPNMQNVPNVGPIPQGSWTIGPQQNNVTSTGTQLPASMRLTPDPGTNTFNRGGFIMHGDNAAQNQTASTGCPVFDLPTRNQVGSSGDNTLRVVP